MNGLASLVRRRPLLSFGVLACALSWACWVPLLVVGHTVRQGVGWPTQVPGLLGPALAALAVTGVLDGRRGVDELMARLGRWRIGWRGWTYALSPVLFLAVGLLVLLVVGRDLPSASDFGRFSGLPAAGPVVAVVVLVLVAGVGEELGWRGFLQQRLQGGHSPVAASLLVVPVWAVWHLPLFGLLATYRGFGLLTLVGFVVGLGCGSVILGRVYGAARGSVLATTVWHGTYNLGAGTEAGTGPLAAVTTTLVMAWAFVILVAFVRRSAPANRVVLVVLRSPLHRMLSSVLVELRLRGRRTGRVITLPVQYARDGDQLVLLPAHAERKLWWRNLQDGADVSLRLGGTTRAGRADVLEAGTPAFDAALQWYVRRFPRAAAAAAASPVLVTVALLRAGVDAGALEPVSQQQQRGARPRYVELLPLLLETRSTMTPPAVMNDLRPAADAGPGSSALAGAPSPDETRGSRGWENRCVPPNS